MMVMERWTKSHSPATTPGLGLVTSTALAIQTGHAEVETDILIWVCSDLIGVIYAQIGTFTGPLYIVIFGRRISIATHTDVLYVGSQWKIWGSYAST